MDPCIRQLPKCKELVPRGIPDAPPKKLKDFLDFTLSPLETKKYKCAVEALKSQKKKWSNYCIQSIGHFEFHKNCRADIMKFCKSVQPGEQRLYNCLDRQKNKSLSPRCSNYLEPDALKVNPKQNKNHNQNTY
jgi:hypothetical protein